MDTLPNRALAGLVAGLIVLTGCTTYTAGHLPRSASAALTAAVTVHNQGRDRIHVYLLEETGEWLLGRVEPLETALLTLPVRSSASQGGMIRLAVIPGASRSLLPSDDRRAVITVRQPVVDVLAQKWVFTGGALVGLPQPGRRR